MIRRITNLKEWVLLFLAFFKKNHLKIINIALGVASFFALLFAFKYLFQIALPMFIGWVMFMIFEPFAAFLHKKGVKKSVATFLSTMTFLIVVVGIVVTVGAIVSSQIIHLAKTLPAYSQPVQEFVIDKADFVQDKIGTLPPETLDKMKEQMTGLIGKFSHFASDTLIFFVTTLSSSVNVIVNLVAGFLFGYLLSIDIKKWTTFFNKYAPRPVKTAYNFLDLSIGKGIKSYIMAQLKLIAVTFIVVLVSLLILSLILGKIDNLFTFAVLSGVFDVLPLLGISTLFIPWIIYLLVVGKTTLAICISVILILVVLIRNVLEPKIAGDSLGVPPSVMFAALIVSAKILGVIGLIVSPILIILVRELFAQGYVTKFLNVHPTDDENQVKDEVNESEDSTLPLPTDEETKKEEH